jgi:flagellar motor switch protein FliN/FliY
VIEPVHNPTIASALVEQLSCELSVAFQVTRFGVADLLEMKPGTVLDSQWDVMKEVPLHVNGRQVAWCEFEVVGQKLGVRITELK